MRALSRKLILVAADTLLLNAAVLLAFLIRFEGNPPAGLLMQYEKLALPFTILSLVVFSISGFYISLWRYASVNEVFVILRGTTASAVVMTALVYGLPAIDDRLVWLAPISVSGFPRSVVILIWVLTTLLIGGLRFSTRYWRRFIRDRQNGHLLFGKNGRATGQRRVVIVGAGDAGAMVAKELLKHEELGCEPVGFIDDDEHKQGMRVNGLPVLGTRENLQQTVVEKRVEEVIIAMPSAPGRVIREIVETCKELPVKLKTLPGMYELLNDNVSINQIRDVQIEDLLGREPVDVDLGEIAGYLAGRRVMVTGAGGSIGSELCRQAARFRPDVLILLDNNENGVFESALDLEYIFPELDRRVIMADVRDREKVERVFAETRPDVVFHAAAHKHVPLMEADPDEAVKTNVFGTRNVAEASLAHGAQRFVLISTDKAVNPTSVMGATKRVAEMIIQSLDAERRKRNPDGTRFVAVRFGNVLGSRGSVVPVFKEQIAHGGPVTVTHPDMRRYFMTIPEAVQLVIQAGAMGEGGEIFVLDMGEPVRITDLAENLIKLSGLEPGVDIQIVVTGPRPGEKLFEELLTSEEGALATRHRLIHIAKIPEVDAGKLQVRLVGLAAAAGVGMAQRVLGALHDLVPDFHPPVWRETASTSFESSSRRAAGV